MLSMHIGDMSTTTVRRRLSAEKVLQCLSQEQELLRDCFRGALTYLFRCDIRIANARLAALRLLRCVSKPVPLPCHCQH